MKFKYIALSGSNQKVEGVLEAASRDEAQQALHKMELSIISLEETAAEAKETAGPPAPANAAGILTFVFEGTDANGKPVQGTIDAQDDYTAFRRLFAEYHFEISAFYPEAALPALRDTYRRKQAEWQARLKTEEGSGTGARTEDDLGVAAQLDRKLLEEVDRVIKTARAILKEHEALFTPPTRLQIEGALEDLLRVRSSNNVKHVTETSRRLFELIDHPDALVSTGAEIQATYRKTMQELEKSDLLKKDMRAYEKALNLQEMSGIFKGLTGRLKNWRGTPGAPGGQSFAARILGAWAVLKNTIFKQRGPGPEKPQGEWLMQIDSFVAWMLFFYLAYFFLADGSLEKNIGLPQALTLKTLSTPLLFNIALILLCTHFMIRVKTRRLQQNAAGSLFLFLLGYGMLGFVIFNF